MIFAAEWLALHLLGVIVVFALLLIVSRKDDTAYKSELTLTIACCLVTLAAKSFYIMGGSKETLLALGKLEYLGKCFGNYCALMFLLRWRNIKVPTWFVHSLLLINVIFYTIIATVDHHHLYYKDTWLAPSKLNLSGYSLEISPAPIYYVYMLFLVAEILGSIGLIISSYYSKTNMPDKLTLHLILIAAMLSPMVLLSLRLLGILKGDDPTPLGILLSCVFLCVAVVRFGLFDPVKNAKNQIINSLKEALVVTDSEHRFLFLNPMAETLVSAIRETDASRRDDEIYSIVKGSGGYFDWCHRHYQVEEQILKTQEITQGYMLTVIDITDIMEKNHQMKKLMEQANAANQAKSAFVSNISHEIRTPMNSIVGITEVMLRSPHSDKEQEYLLNIQSSGKALLTIINDILDYSKMESGKMQLVPEPYDTLSLFHDLKLTLENQIKDPQVAFYFELDPALPCVLNGDGGRIRQIVTNLVNNSMKYTKAGYVRFSVKVKSMKKNRISLLFAVEDTGIGIKKEDQALLFDSFQRVDLKKNRQIEGTGLGLTISQNFVNMMGGSIKVESEYGKGSRFSFLIDQDIVDHTPISEVDYDNRRSNVIEKEAESLFTAPDASILLVDDNDLNLQVAKDLLAPLQLQIDTAENGKQALGMVQKKHYDLVLMDHMMPVMDGIEATQAIRALSDDAYRTLPIIALTANAMIDARNAFFDAGMNDFTAKPIDFKAICTKLKRWLPKEKVHTLSKEESVSLLSSTPAEDKNILPKPAANAAGFDPELGLKNCGTEKILMRSIDTFYQTIDRGADRIEQFYQEARWNDYAIEVHALKSTALLIGARSLFDAAKELEEAAANGKEAVISEKTMPLLTMYRDLKPVLKPYINEVSEKTKVSSEAYKALLLQINTCMEQFDLDGVDSAMEKLEACHPPDILKESAQKLGALVADVAMEDVIKLTNEMIALLNEQGE